METKEVKALLGINHTNFDSQIKVLIPVYEDYVKVYCNSDFSTGYPPSVQLAIALLIDNDINGKNGIKSESVGDASVTYEEGTPNKIKQLLKAYKVAKFS